MSSSKGQKATSRDTRGSSFKAFVTKLRKRHIIETLAGFVGGGWLLIEVVERLLVGHYKFPEETIDLTVVSVVGALLSTLVWRWFRGTDERPGNVKGEVLLVPLIILTALTIDLNLILDITGVSGNRLLIGAIALFVGIVWIVFRSLRWAALTPEPATKQTQSPKTAGVKSHKSIVVLPFKNISADPEQEYFCDGITEELITGLSKNNALQVVSRTSAFIFKNTPKKAREIGDELNVGYVLEGSVRKAGNRIRIAAQLIETLTDTHIWSETYDGDLEDIFEIQEKVSQAIADALKLEFKPAEKEPEKIEYPISRVSTGLKKLAVPALIVLLATGTTTVFFLKSRGPHYDPKRIIASVFENQTGDKSLDPIGRMASDWINQGMSKTGLVEVVTVPPGETAPGTAKENERLRALAKESGAGMLVSGTYFLQGKTLSFHSQINDMSKGKVIKALDPVSGPVEEPIKAIETLRQKVMGALAVISDPRIAPTLDLSSSLPSYEAYKEYMIANEIWTQHYDMRSVIEHLSRASELDPSFIPPMLSAAWAHYNLGERVGDLSEFAKAEELVKKVDRSREELSLKEKLYLDWMKANLRGDQAEELRLARQLASIGGEWKWTLAMEAMRSNCPREAVETLSKLDPAGIFMKDWTGYWWVMTMSYHMLGEYKQELKQARRGHKQYPEDIWVLSFEVQALAALGRIEEIKKLVNESLSMPPGGLDPGLLMIEAGRELKLHGFKKESLALLERAIKWLEARPSEEAKTKDYRSLLADAFYVAEKWEDACTLYEGLLKDNPENLDYLAYCGSLAARRGDREETLRISKQLEEMKNSYLFGKNTYHRACIASVLREKEDAVRLLQEAISQGLYFDRLYTELDLEPLRDFPPFKELMKPKG